MGRRRGGVRRVRLVWVDLGHVGWDCVEYTECDAVGLDAMRWSGMGWDAVEWDGMRCGGVGLEIVG